MTLILKRWQLMQLKKYRGRHQRLKLVHACVVSFIKLRNNKCIHCKNLNRNIEHIKTVEFLDMTQSLKIVRMCPPLPYTHLNAIEKLYCNLKKNNITTFSTRHLNQDSLEISLLASDITVGQIQIRQYRNL